MRKQVARLELTDVEIGNAIAQYVAINCLNKEDKWNEFNLNLKLEFIEGKIIIQGATLIYWQNTDKEEKGVETNNVN